MQDSVFPSAVAPRSLFHFGDGRDCAEDELEGLWFRLDIRQLFYAPNITFRTLHSSQANKNYRAEKTPPKMDPKMAAYQRFLKHIYWNFMESGISGIGIWLNL